MPAIDDAVVVVGSDDGCGVGWVPVRSGYPGCVSLREGERERRGGRGAFEDVAEVRGRGGERDGEDAPGVGDFHFCFGRLGCGAHGEKE